MKHLFRVAFQPDDEVHNFEPYGENLSPNIRALRMAITSAEVLLAAGVSVSDTVSMALDITDRYCKRKVQFDISSTIIMASQDRGDDREPLTLIRQAHGHAANIMQVQSLQELIREIDRGNIDLDAAEDQLDAILHKPRTYPFWLTTLGGALISFGVGVMFGAKPIILAIMLALGASVTYVLHGLSKQHIPTFFAQVFSALVITLVAAGVTWLGDNSLEIFDNVNPTLIVIGGIVMLVAGMTIVAAVQDAIDEYYITANARLLKVVMMTIGIVAGVIGGLYFAQQLGVSVTVDSKSPPLGRGDWQIAGAVLISIGYALSMQSRWTSILVSGGIGALAWVVYMVSTNHAGATAVVASGLAAVAVGLVGTLIARVWRTPSSALIMAGIVPLVPGLTLYRGLRQVVEGSSSTGSLDQGVLTLFTAALIALAIASGASLGILIGRPMRRTLVRARNALPRQS